MAALDTLFLDLAKGLQALQELQDRYDAVGWRVSSPAFNKFRHIVIHVSSLSGKLSNLCEEWDHQSDSGEAVNLFDHQAEMEMLAADLVFHAAQLGNLLDFALRDAVRRRYITNAERFAPDSEFAHLAK